MLDPVRAKARVIAVTAASFVGGLLIASGLEWTTGIEASSVFQTPPAPQEVRPMAELSEAFISISESVTPAVVAIRTERPAQTARSGMPEDLPESWRRFFQIPPNQDPQPQRAGGTGFIISADGHILTNNHVVADATSITVVTMDRREYPAELVGRDPTTDIAVIRIPAQNLPQVRIGDPNSTRVGEWVLAIGNPLALDFTVTAGIVSAKNRTINIIRQSISDEDIRNFAVESFIQTDAAINPGNSGGPLVNIRGEVIGVNTAIASNTGLSQGYGFAVPIDLARHVADDLIRYGRWRRAVLGVEINEVSVEDAEVFRLPSVAGAVVQRFSTPNTPAERAGLAQGDVIVGVNGQPVTHVNQLQRMIATQRPGDRVTLDVIRYGDRRAVQAQLIEAPSNGVAAASPAPALREAPATEGRLGIRAVPLTPEAARTLGFAAAGGVVIEEVSRYGPIGERFPQARGFKIALVDGTPITDLPQFERLIREKPAGSVVSLQLQAPDGVQRIVNVRLRS